VRASSAWAKEAVRVAATAANDSALAFEVSSYQQFGF